MSHTSKRLALTALPIALAGLACIYSARMPSASAPPPLIPTTSPPAVAAVPPQSPRADSSAATATKIPAGPELARRCLALAEHDPLAAMDLALRENLCALDPGLLPNLVLRWAGQDFDGALAWTRTQAEPDWRDDLLSRLAYLRAQTDPLAAARIVVTDIGDGPRRDEAIISVLHQWALRDAEAARLWADSLPAGPRRIRAVMEAANISPSRS